jgi:hypothetical protein
VAVAVAALQAMVGMVVLEAAAAGIVLAEHLVGRVLLVKALLEDHILVVVESHFQECLDLAVLAVLVVMQILELMDRVVLGLQAQLLGHQLFILKALLLVKIQQQTLVGVVVI